ncbi:MAG: EFR1 family ferrodoxin [Termitinemataceae bacterium]|nr:MAG: EFR1 family ferrodoxin [Termitinemataceae bacterium]
MKKNVIFYFTGTGNSLRSANLIAGRIGDCDVINVAHVKKSDGYDGYMLEGKPEKVGFVFPAYAQGLPNIMRKFIKTLEMPGIRTAYFFAVVTCGSASGNALAQVQALLSSKRLDMTYGASIKMFSNCIALYKMQSTANEQAAESDIEIKRIADEIANDGRADIPKAKGMLNFVYNLAIKSFPKNAKKYRVLDCCKGCGHCVNICPVGNIALENGKPVFAENCEQCMACIQWCPNHAINYKSTTKESVRYHHPSISYEEMIK